MKEKNKTVMKTCYLFENINKTNKPLVRFKKRETQMTKIRTERGNITTNLTDKKKKDYKGIL